MTQKWNRIDKFIFEVESRIGKKLDSVDNPISDLREKEPDEEVFEMAQAKYNASELERLKKFRFPRPLRANTEGFLCSNCGRIVMVELDTTEDNGSYCRYCGQRYSISLPSKAAARYVAEHSNNRG